MSRERREELAANLGDVRARIEAAAKAAGRDADEVTLVAITKTWPASDVAILADLGVRDVGESRDQEASAKFAELQNPRPCLAESQAPRLTWHFVGALQTNKVGSVARYADVVHSVDRGRLVAALGRAALGRETPLGVLLQANLDPMPTPDRGGAPAAEVLGLAAAVAAAPALELRGLMLVAPPGVDPAPVFAELAELSAALRVEYPRATWISAGMSGDLEAAVAAGATHVRVGSGLLGPRPRRR
ncbi:MAG: YggS family pyridoxal phosphate-dependent enzyme [Sporichthyaceae bacterium]